MNTANGKNRGYFKIKGASSAFNFDFKGKTVLDIGSSTGGFTKYALDQGAKKVIAIEKGTNQMIPALKNDPRVDLHEKTDIFDYKCAPHIAAQDVTTLCAVNQDTTSHVTASDSAIPDVILADVSFLSLTNILKYAKMNLSRSDTDFLVMLKPQFEARPYQLNNGIVKNEKMRRDIIKTFEHWLKDNGFIIVNKKDNDLHGRHGNTERFYWLKREK